MSAPSGIHTGTDILKRLQGAAVRIPISKIIPDPGLPENLESVRDLPRGSRTARDPVVLAEKGRYVLLAGARRLRTAMEAGEKELDCTVKEAVTEQEKWELQLAEQYHSSLVPPMQLGRAFIQYRDKYGVTQQELARRTGITPGTIHHYESLIRTLAPGLGGKVDSGELTFKEARSIADIEDHERQMEIAKPFVDGVLSSVHVERIVDALERRRVPRPVRLPVVVRRRAGRQHQVVVAQRRNFELGIERDAPRFEIDVRDLR